MMRDHKPISIADQVFEKLERDILSGKYPQGEILSELRLAQRRAVDGLLQRGEQGRTDVADGRRLCSMQLRQNIRFVQGKGHRPMSIFKIVGFHKQPPMKTNE